VDSTEQFGADLLLLSLEKQQQGYVTTIKVSITNQSNQQSTVMTFQDVPEDTVSLIRDLMTELEGHALQRLFPEP
tara:strand:- start:364 stop:588 length:225 start_codon:yes stop_codon:yes gene_type:complete